MKTRVVSQKKEKGGNAMKKKRTPRLWIYFSLTVFLTLIITLSIIYSLTSIFYDYNDGQYRESISRLYVFLLFVISVLIGTLISVFVGRKILKPLTYMDKILRQVAKGDFSARLPEKSIIREVSDMSASFNTMAKELAGTETLRNDFIVNVSHEFKTPIAAIQGYATLLQDENVPKEKQNEYIEKIVDNSGRLSMLCQNILNLSKLENQQMITDKKTYRLDEQIRKAVLALEPLWSKKNIEFDINLPKQSYNNNEALVYHVWHNLIANAIKFTDENGLISIKMTSGDNSVIVSVADNGCGMTEDVQKHIFEKFYQGDTTRKAEGNGLGLALVKRIVDLCSGTVNVQSSPGNGATFIVELPL